jgi:hypothetical protein
MILKRLFSLSKREKRTTNKVAASEPAQRRLKNASVYHNWLLRATAEKTRAKV